MGLKEGLLCLLAGGDSHGYELKSRLEAATGDTWQINIGQVYTTLQRLERDGLVVHADADEGRVVYSLTEAGRLAAIGWMATPVDLAVAGGDGVDGGAPDRSTKAAPILVRRRSLRRVARASFPAVVAACLSLAVGVGPAFAGIAWSN